MQIFKLFWFKAYIRTGIQQTHSLWVEELNKTPTSWHKKCTGELMCLIKRGPNVETKIKNGKMHSTENDVLKTLAQLL